MKVYFFIEHPLNFGIWRKTNIKKFLCGEKEAELNFKINKFNQISSKPFQICGDERFREIELLNKKILTQEQRHLEQIRILRSAHEEEINCLRFTFEFSKVTNPGEAFKSDECVICYTEKPNILFCNCGHLCLCEECNKLISNNKRPVCREVNSIKRKI